MKELIIRKIAWLLPKQLVYWCAIRLGAHATVGKYGSEDVPNLRFMTALQCWEWK